MTLLKTLVISSLLLLPANLFAQDLSDDNALQSAESALGEPSASVPQVETAQNTAPAEPQSPAEPLVQRINDFSITADTLTTMCKDKKPGHYPKIDAAIDNLRLSIRKPLNYKDQFRSGPNYQWKIKAVTLDVEHLSKNINKIVPADIPVLVRSFDSLDDAIKDSLRNVLPSAPVQTAPQTPAAPPASTPSDSAAPPAPASASASSQPDLEPLEYTPEEQAMLSVKKIRHALSQYHKVNSTYPASLNNLIPAYILELPKISLSNMPETDSVLNIENDIYGDDIRGALTGIGAYVYFSDPKSSRFGQIYIDSYEKMPNGEPLYTYK